MHLTLPMANSRGEQALQICMACHDRFSKMMPLAVHPRSKHGTALRLRALCRSAVRPASSIHIRLCWQLLQHRNHEVRYHIMRLVAYGGPRIWYTHNRASSEATSAGEPRSDDTGGSHETVSHCAHCCDPLRQIVVAELLPCLSAVLSRSSLLHWLRNARQEIFVCHCGRWYRYLGREALTITLEHLRALRKYLDRVYTRSTEAKQSRQVIQRAGG